MITIAVIRETEFNFQKSKYYGNLSLLTQDIAEYIQIVSCPVEDLLPNIVENIQLGSNALGDSHVCYETATHVYQLCVVANDNLNNLAVPPTGKQVNVIGKYLVGEAVYGTCVLINTRIGENGLGVADSVTLDNVVQILYSKFVHIGVVIGITELKQFDYFAHPIEYYSITNEKDFDNYSIVDIPFLGFSLCAVVHKQTPGDTINKKATRLVGDRKVYGEILLISKSPHEYYDLTIELCEKMLKLAYGPLANRRTEEVKEVEINGLPVIYSRYALLDKKYEEYTDTCTCGVALTDKHLTCTGCYRMVYHDAECQKADWVKHKPECLH